MDLQLFLFHFIEFLALLRKKKKKKLHLKLENPLKNLITQKRGEETVQCLLVNKGNTR